MNEVVGAGGKVDKGGGGGGGGLEGGGGTEEAGNVAAGLLSDPGCWGVDEADGSDTV